MLSDADRATLLAIARTAIAAAAGGQPPPALDAAQLGPALLEARATFVTLTLGHNLRGCIGGLYASAPLVQDVRDHARAAALDDPRFPPVSPREVPHLRIEVSVLTPPEALEFQSPEDLLQQLHPGQDGVILVHGYRRATFLPQVWEKVPDPTVFMDMLSEKMGAAPDAWRMPGVEVYRYAVEVFEEPEAPARADP